MASLGDQFFVDVPTQSDDWVDFEQFLDMPVAFGDDYSASATVSPDMSLPYDAETLGNDLSASSQSTFAGMSNYGTSKGQFLLDQSPVFGLMSDEPILDDEMFNAYQPYDNAFSFRQMVETQAAADPRTASIKEKRREAAIALHLQRLCDATARDLDMSSDSNTSFSSPNWSDYMRESISPQPANFGSPKVAPSPASASNAGAAGGLEMVLDLNMNATTNLPKKQKPRSQAQKENYIKARKYGACEKHKKQHKRCNCLEKAAARSGVSEVPLSTSIKERPRQPMLQVPVLPDMHSSGVPGHDPSQVPRPSVKTIKRSISSSPEHDPSRGLCAVIPTVRKTKQPDVPGYAQQQSTSAVLPSVKAIKQREIAGHDRQQNVSVTPTANNTGQRTSGVLGDNSLCNSPGVLWAIQNAGKRARAAAHEQNCRPQSGLHSVKASRESTMLWRALGMPGEERNKRNTPATANSDTCSSNPILEVRRPKKGGTSRSVHVSVSQGTATNQSQSHNGPCDSKLVAYSGFSQRSTPRDVQRPPQIISTHSSHGPEQVPALRSSTSVSLRRTTGAVSPEQTVRSITSQIGGLFSSAVSTISGAWYSQVSRSLGFFRSEALIFNCLSFCGARMMAARKVLRLSEL